MPLGPAEDRLPGGSRWRARSIHMSPISLPTRNTPIRRSDDARQGAARMLGVPLLRKDDAARRHRHRPPARSSRSPKADRAAAELRGAGGDRDGERAAHHRDARGAGAADRDRRGLAGHQFLARRPCAGVRRDARKGDAACAGPHSAVLSTYDGEQFRVAARSRGVPAPLPSSCASLAAGTRRSPYRRVLRRRARSSMSSI